MTNLAKPEAGRIPNAPHHGAPPETGFWQGIGVLSLTLLGIVVFLVLAILATQLGLIPTTYGVGAPENGAPYQYPVTGDPDIDARSLTTAVRNTAFIFLTNAFVVLAVFSVSFWLIAKRRVLPLIGNIGLVRCDFRYALLILLPFYVGVAVFILARTDIDPLAWITAHPVAAALIFLSLPIQTLVEEIIFRGFIQQWLTRLIGSAVIAAWIQSALFALLHADKFVESFIFALAASTLTVGTRNLGAAWALHLCNNAFLIVFGFLPATEAGLLTGYSLPDLFLFDFGVTALAALGLMLIYGLIVHRRESASPT